jgi:hypothetical protein
MAGVARGGKSLKLPGSSILVTLIALHKGMRSHQGEAIVVVPDCIH